MIRFVNMPYQLPSELSPVLGSVCVGVGERVEVGDILFTYSYDGALFEERACVAGEIIAIFFDANDAVSGGCPVMAIGEDEGNG